MGLSQFKHVEGTPKHKPAPRTKPETKAEARLNRRRADYSKMIAQIKIGDGHRDATGYHRPGSNKK